VLIVLYSGAVAALEKHGLLSQIRRTAGASTGAVMSTLVSLKLSAEQIKRYLDDLDFSKIPQTYEEIPPPKKWFIFEKNRERMQCWRRFRDKLGFYANSYFYHWLQDIIGTHTGNPRITFAEFRARGFHDLHVVVTNVTRHSTEIFSADTTPDVAVADAVRMSTAIPLFFEAMKFDGKQFGSGDYYCDGGFTNNYPLSMFDHDKFAPGNPYYDRGINWETLGFYHSTAIDPAKIKPIVNRRSYIANLMIAMTVGSDFAVKSTDVTRKRTVVMSDCGVQQANFSLKQTDENYGKLFETGRQATEDFIAAYEPPTPTNVA
jgi:NTE family protein